MTLSELYDIAFPIQIYEDDFYPCKLNISEKYYLAFYEKFNGDISKVDCIMQTQVSSRTLLTVRKHLEELGIIEQKLALSPEEAKQYAILNSHRGIKCEWCGRESNVIQKHHFPILAKNGGKDTVNICPNCHYTYHKVMGELE